jgi:hypothetical protein
MEFAKGPDWETAALYSFFEAGTILYMQGTE